ncbi:hemerythrin domain-containing protein [Methyloglobulus sp.]|uniref:hemerythrin domain-containing protein n=1 Tax=Methyloglobulus sp. TaxID=2518622 RepID=UPI003989BB23
MTNAKKSENADCEMDAIDLLTSDHHEVETFFKKYKKLTHKDADSEQRLELAGKICQALSVYAQIEEEIFYPTLRKALEEGDLLDEAEVEHATVKSLIEQTMASSPDEPLYDAKVMVLGEYVDHHVKEEEGQLFKKARKAKVDLDKLGMNIATRKSELMEEQNTDKKSKHASNASSASHKKSSSEART